MNQGTFECTAVNAVPAPDGSKVAHVSFTKLNGTGDNFNAAFNRQMPLDEARAMLGKRFQVTLTEVAE